MIQAMENDPVTTRSTKLKMESSGWMVELTVEPVFDHIIELLDQPVQNTGRPDSQCHGAY